MRHGSADDGFIYFLVELQPRYKAQYLLDYVCQQLDVVEKDYFGLRYVNTRKQRKWFDFTKSVANQMRGIHLNSSFLT